MERDFRRLALALGTALVFGLADARETTAIQIAEREVLTADQVYRRGVPPRTTTHQLALALVYFTGGTWSRDAVVQVAGDAADILQPCGLRLRQVEIVRVDAPRRYHYFETPISRELARALPLPRPTVYFVTDTRQQPAFDAEAIGRGNSRTRPELADTVWLTHATHHAAIALAHELAHVLMDSGEHVDLPDNLMRDETAPENTRLTDTQCARMREVAVQNGLLRRE